MEATKSWLSLGKLRVGWGILGNNRIDELSRYTYLVNGYNYPYGMGNHQLQPGITALTIGNPDIKWEKTETFNVGLDLSFFQNSLTMGVEYFNKKTSDMLLTVPTVPSAGLSSDPIRGRFAGVEGHFANLGHLQVVHRCSGWGKGGASRNQLFDWRRV